jgi:hypothetical protein
MTRCRAATQDNLEEGEQLAHCASRQRRRASRGNLPLRVMPPAPDLPYWRPGGNLERIIHFSSLARSTRFEGQGGKVKRQCYEAIRETLC